MLRGIFHLVSRFSCNIADNSVNLHYFTVLLFAITIIAYFVELSQFYLISLFQCDRTKKVKFPPPTFITKTYSRVLSHPRTLKIQLIQYLLLKSCSPDKSPCKKKKNTLVNIISRRNEVCKWNLLSCTACVNQAWSGA